MGIFLPRCFRLLKKRLGSQTNPPLHTMTRLPSLSTGAPRHRKTTVPPPLPRTSPGLRQPSATVHVYLHARASVPCLTRLRVDPDPAAETGRIDPGSMRPASGPANGEPRPRPLRGGIDRAAGTGGGTRQRRRSSRSTSPSPHPRPPTPLG